MLDMVYCGYTEFSVVIIFIRLMFIFLVWLISIFILLLNIPVWVIRVKIIRQGIGLDWEILLNIWNLLFLRLVLIIRIRVIIFSIRYMSGVKVGNFIFLYIRFVFRIVWLILNNNFYWIILGWDGLGVVSFFVDCVLYK